LKAADIIEDVARAEAERLSPGHEAALAVMNAAAGRLESSVRVGQLTLTGGE
jgi:hypothetical protein